MTRIEQRIDTAARWTSQNPRLLKGEVGWESDTLKVKVGDGVRRWNDLPYAMGSTPTKESLGLGNVDNTSDMDKPVSTAVDAALDDMVEAFDQAILAKADKNYVDENFLFYDAQFVTYGQLVNQKAPLASPTFTGDPKAPTPATADNDTSIATTAFVKAQGFAPLASPTFTGDPKAPTPALDDNDTSVATTAFVKNSVKTDSPVKGTPNKQHQIVAAVLRNTGSGFEVLTDTGHAPIEVGSVETTSTYIRLTLPYTASKVNAVAVVPDETFAKAGYVFGGSVGLDSITIQGSQPGGFGDYVWYNGSSWQSLNGFITGFTFDAAGYLTCTHAPMAPVGGSFTSRSLVNRGVLDSMGDTTTRLAWVNASGVTIKAPTTDLRGWLTRTGSAVLDPTKLTTANSNLWVFGIMER